MVKVSDPDRWQHLIVQPGDMHAVLPCTGCTGTLVCNRHSQEPLDAAFKWTASVLRSRAWPRAPPGLRMTGTILTFRLKRHIRNGRCFGKCPHFSHRPPLERLTHKAHRHFGLSPPA